MKSQISKKQPDQKSDLASRSLKVAIETHGCKLNQGDSQNLARQFMEAGYEIRSKDEPVDIYVVNTCTVTHVADRKARHALRAAKRLNPKALIVATGCYADRNPTSLSNLKEVDIIAGNEAKELLVNKVLSKLPNHIIPCSTGDNINNNEHINDISRTRAMVKIQKGCNQICAYCIVPKVRGREKSILPNVIISEIQSLLTNGYKEIVLTGTQLGTYGFDIPQMELHKLIKLILTETELPRLRVSSLQPQEISPQILSLWSNPRLCPHFHIPLQSGSDRILKLMRRRYSNNIFEQKVQEIYRTIPDVSITTDVIVGFPGESDQDFEETYNLCQRVKFSSIHVFPYSTRPGTSAAYFKNQIHDSNKTLRSHKLLALSSELVNSTRNKYLGQIRPVLWEQSKYLNRLQIWYGLTDNYLRVYTENKLKLTNQITQTLLKSNQDGLILGEVDSSIKTN